MNKKRQDSKVILGAVLGNILEYYDNTLYGYMSAKLATVFFPTDDAFMSMLSSFGAFAAGFAMRPLGGIVFGHVADRWGRMRGLTLSIFLTTVATCTIGLLPSYQTAGILAPLTLVLCRLLQGLSVGGEYGTSTALVLDVAKSGKSNFTASLLSASAFVGAILGTILGALCTASFMPEWGWRIPFLFGAVTGIIGLYLRRTLEPYFPPPAVIAAIPLLNLVKEHPRNLFCSMGIGAFSAVPFYLLSIYMNSRLMEEVGFSSAQTLLWNALILLFITFMVPLNGWVADRIGNYKVMKIALIGAAITAYPLFWLIEHPTLPHLIVVQIIFSLISSSFLSGTNTFLASLFPSKSRCTGISFGYCLGGALCGGTTPMIALTLVHWTGDPKAPAFYLLLTCILGWLGVSYAKRL